jgi:hypothetical protein
VIALANPLGRGQPGGLTISRWLAMRTLACDL